MPPITIYTSAYCPYCSSAKRLLKSKGAPFNEIDVDGRPDVREAMTRKAGRHTVPQIWIGDTHVGGCDDLFALDDAGKLDGMLR